MSNTQSVSMSDFNLKVNRRTTRFERDIQQRKSAKSRYAQVRKMLPKVIRERDVRKEQFARRNVSVYKNDDDEFRQEGFGSIPQAATILGAVGVGAFLSKAGSKVLGILGNVTKSTNLANKLLEDIIGVLESLKSAVISLLDKLWVVPVAVLAYWLLSKFAGNTAVVVLITTAVAAIFGKPMWAFVSQHFVPGFRQESGFGENPFKSFIMAVMCFSYLPKEAGKLMTALLTRVSILPRLSAGLDSLFQVAISICEAVINTILSMVSKPDEDGKKPKVFLGDAAYKAVRQWISESYAHKALLFDKPSTSEVVEVYDHVKKGYVILQTLKDAELSSIMKRSLDSLEFSLQPFMGVVTAGKNFRAEPHFVLFTGKAGVGKSSLLVKFAISVLLLSGEAKPSDVLTQLFQKGSTEYWNGYVGQKCTIVDDIFQKVAALGEADSEYENIIRMVNSWLFPLNMADLPSKGKFFFDSPLIMGTTNCSNIKETSYAQVVKSDEAIVRRIHDVIYIEASNDYTNDGKMDYEKMENEFLTRLMALDPNGDNTPEAILSCVPWEAWQAQKVDFQSFVFPASGQPFHNPLDLKDLVLSVARSLRVKKAQHKASIGAMDEYANLLGKTNIEPQAGDQVHDKSEIEPIAGQPAVRSADYVPVPSSIEDKIQKTTEEYASHEQRIHRNWPLPPDERRLANLIRRFNGQRYMYTLKLEEINRRSNILEEFRKPKDFLTNLLLTLRSGSDLYFFERLKDYVEPAINADARIERDNHNRKLLGLIQRVEAEEPLDYKSAELALVSIFNVCSTPGFFEKIGMNSMAVTALMSTLGAIRRDLDNYFETVKDLNVWLNKQATYHGVIFGMFQSLMTSVKRLSPMGIVSGVLGIYTMVKILKMSFKVIVSILKSIYTSIRAILGLGDEEVKTVVDEPVVQTQGNHVAVLQDAQTYDKIYANLYTIFLPDIDVQIGHLLFIESNLAVMPFHLITDIQKRLQEGKISEDARLSLLNGAERYNKIHITVKQFLTVPRYSNPDLVTDSVFLHFPNAMNVTAKSRIIQHFISEEDYKSVAMSALPCRMDTTKLAKSGDTIRMQRHTSSAPVVKKVVGMPIGPVTPEFMWSSCHTTQLGDCGSPHMLSRRSTCPKSRCILGIHVGGNASFCQPLAVAIPVSLEMVMDAKKHFGTISDEFTEDLESKGIKLSMVDVEVQSGLKMVGLTGGSFELIGELDKAVSIAPRSKFTHTPLSKEEPFGPSGLKIAHLSPVVIDGVVKYPMVEGLRNYQSPLIYREIPDLDLIVSIATSQFQKESVYDTREIFTFEEAVLSPALMKLKAINRATSAGYPFVLDGMPGKRAYFGSGEEYDLSGPECAKLKDRVEHILSCAAEGRRLSHICIDFLKDETRPAAKVDACATRIISGTPLDYSIACRMMFGAFMAAMFRCNTLSGFTPGINPYQDWWILASKLKEGGDFFFDGDFSRFDASEQPYILWAILKFINNWYDDGPVNAKIREVLFMDLVHSRHLTSHHGPLRYVVQWTKCLPSGHPMTTPVNSIYAMIALVLCYARTTGSCVDFWDHCFAVTNGDDNVVATKESRIALFNQVTVEKAMRDHLDLTYTSGSKDGTLVVHKPFDSLIYLKRSFKKDEDNSLARGGWLAPLELQSFLYSAYVTRARKDVAQDICNNLEFALGELSLHDAEKWDCYAHKIKDQMLRFDRAPKLGVSRDSYRQFMASKTDFWY